MISEDGLNVLPMLLWHTMSSTAAWRSHFDDSSFAGVVIVQL